MFVQYNISFVEFSDSVFSNVFKRTFRTQLRGEFDHMYYVPHAFVNPKFGKAFCSTISDTNPGKKQIKIHGDPGRILNLQIF